EVRTVEFATQVYEDDGEKLIRCNLRDISSLKREMAISRRQAERLRLVNRIALMVNERLNLDSTLSLITEEIQRHLESGMVAVLRRNPDGETLRVLAAAGGDGWNPQPAGLAPGMVLAVHDSALLAGDQEASFVRVSLAT